MAHCSLSHPHSIPVLMLEQALSFPDHPATIDVSCKWRLPSPFPSSPACVLFSGCRTVQVDHHLPEAGVQTVRGKLETLLSAAAAGIAANTAATPEDVLVFVHSALTVSAAASGAGKRRLQGAPSALAGEDAGATHSQADACMMVGEYHRHSSLQTGLRLLEIEKGAL